MYYDMCCMLSSHHCRCWWLLAKSCSNTNRPSQCACARSTCSLLKHRMEIRACVLFKPRAKPRQIEETTHLIIITILNRRINNCWLCKRCVIFKAFTLTPFVCRRFLCVLIINIHIFHTDERDAIQKKTFTKWVNKHLKKVRSVCGTRVRSFGFRFFASLSPRCIPWMDSAAFPLSSSMRQFHSNSCILQLQHSRKAVCTKAAPYTLTGCGTSAAIKTSMYRTHIHMCVCVRVCLGWTPVWQMLGRLTCVLLSAPRVYTKCLRNVSAGPQLAYIILPTYYRANGGMCDNGTTPDARASRLWDRGLPTMDDERARSPRGFRGSPYNITSYCTIVAFDDFVALVSSHIESI